MPVPMEPPEQPRITTSRGLSLLAGAAIMLAVLMGGSVMLSKAPTSAIVGPDEIAGSRDPAR